MFDRDSVSDFINANYDSWRRTPISRPSLRVSLDRKSRQGQWIERVTGKRRLSTALNNNKCMQKELYREICVPHPITIAGPSSLHELVLGLTGGGRITASERCVIKPVAGKNSWCVHPVRAYSGKIQDLSTGHDQSAEDFVTAVGQEAKRRRLSDNWIAEQYIEPQRPKRGLLEFKCYAFSGVVGIVLLNQYIAGEKLSVWLDPQMVSQEAAKKHAVNNAHPDACSREQFDQALAFAGAVSKSLPMAFARIDCFGDGNEFKAGEVTPWPGRYFGFRQDLDLLLGAMFEISQINVDLNHDFSRMERLWPEFLVRY